MPAAEKHKVLAASVSEQLKEIEKCLPDGEGLDIRIPVGVIRTVREITPEYSFAADKTVRRNICYAVEALDFYRWIINWFGIYGPVAGYLYKTGIVLIDSIVEATTRLNRPGFPGGFFL